MTMRLFYLLPALLLLNTARGVPVGIWGGLPYTEDGPELERLADEYGMTIVVIAMKAGCAICSYLFYNKIHRK